MKAKKWYNNNLLLKGHSKVQCNVAIISLNDETQTEIVFLKSIFKFQMKFCTEMLSVGAKRSCKGQEAIDVQFLFVIT